MLETTRQKLLDLHEKSEFLAHLSPAEKLSQTHLHQADLKMTAQLLTKLDACAARAPQASAEKLRDARSLVQRTAGNSAAREAALAGHGIFPAADFIENIKF